MNNDDKKRSWVDCETRAHMACDALRPRIAMLRHDAWNLRKAFVTLYMSEPCCYVADALDEAADKLQSKLDEVKA